jgi:hypothetical protein
MSENYLFLCSLLIFPGVAVALVRVQMGLVSRQEQAREAR